VRVAIQGGAKLVPVMTFGENEVYVQVKNQEGSCLRWLQMTVKAYFGFTVPLFCGRSWLPLLPKSTALSTIVGAPVAVKHSAEPTEVEIDEAHGR